MREHIYRGPSEVEPRATASGFQNVVRGRGLGLLPREVFPVRACPAWGCGDAPILRFDGRGPTGILTPAPTSGPGATSTVPQPLPPTQATPSQTAAPGALPISPAPSPVVSAPTDAPVLTSTATGISAWLQESLITGIPNWGLAAAGIGLAWMIFSGKGRR